ncbi:LacI family transcriptional regulator [bacterium]|nr:MAG: LacI family transcriptional regulator [bacterium]
MSDIAARAGTTIGVVSVALNGGKSKTLRVSAETRLRIQTLADELGYRRDPRASALATGKNHVIGLMLPHAHSFAVPDPFYSLVSSGVAAAASQLGYNLMLYTAVAEEESDRATKMIDRRVDGLILVLPPEGTPIVEECHRRGIRAISIIQRPEQSPLSVNSCDYEGGRLATEHLLDLGHRRIAHLHGNRVIHTSQARYQAYVDALANAGIEADPNLTRDGKFDRGIAKAATQELLKLPSKRRPTAIFAANDLSAHGAIDAIYEAGLRVPEDISVVGYDDTWYALVTSPPLTSVNMAVDLIGRRAAEMLIASIDGRPDEHHAVLPVSLTVRRSSGPPPPEPR